MECACAKPTLMKDAEKIEEQLSAGKNGESTCKVLLEQYANVNAELYDGGTALILAVKAGHQKALSFYYVQGQILKRCTEVMGQRHCTGQQLHAIPKYAGDLLKVEHCLTPKTKWGVRH